MSHFRINYYNRNSDSGRAYNACDLNMEATKTSGEKIEVISNINSVRCTACLNIKFYKEAVYTKK